MYVLTFVKVDISNHPINANNQKRGGFKKKNILNIRERLRIMRGNERQQLLPFMLG